ncbi:MAG: peptidoglycan-binding protein, partial [Leptolyngbyaceae bacterium]|nr:peptidoglycan-binding protein [Leptolyngbyaceae bacterium]
MESIAFLEATLTYESYFEYADIPLSFNFWGSFHQKKLTSWVWFCLLEISLVLAILSFAVQALALLSLGSRGSEVKSLQIRLSQGGYDPGVPDGVYGNLTKQAVEQFQAAKGLTVDGIAGERTLKALENSHASRASYSPNTLELQKLLANRGFYAGNIDGIFGSMTRKAVKEAQQFYGLATDGIAGPRTLAALNSSSTSNRNSDSQNRQSTVELQRLLQKQGFYFGAIDGISGSQTKAGIKAAQQAYGLQVDGIAGPKTLAALQAGSPTGNSTRYSQSTMELQQLLTKHNFYDGAIDGVSGPQTQEAIQAAQQAYGLQVDGIAGPKTLAALQAGSPSASPAKPRDSNTTLPSPAPPQQAQSPVTASPSSPKPSVQRLSVPVIPPISFGKPYRAEGGGSITVTSKVEDILSLQKLLAARGFYQGPLDGIYGVQTRM